MNTALVLSTTVILNWSMKSSNPVKTSMSILLVGMTLFFVMSLNSGKTWISVLMLMLFMGGIIMIFMILSSILPNEKSMKMKNPFIFMNILIMMMLFLNNWTSMGQLMGENTKFFLASGSNFYMMMSLILIYFCSCMSMLSTEMTPMRALSCS